MAPSTYFPTKDILTPHRYKATLRAHLTVNWPHIFTKYRKGMEVSSTSNYGAIVISTCWWRHQILQKTPQNIKKSKKYHIRMSMLHQLLGVPPVGHFLILLHCAGIGIDRRHCENRSTFFSMLPRGKEKNIFSKCSFLSF